MSTDMALVDITITISTNTVCLRIRVRNISRLIINIVLLTVYQSVRRHKNSSNTDAINVSWAVHISPPTITTNGRWFDALVRRHTTHRQLQSVCIMGKRSHKHRHEFNRKISRSSSSVCLRPRLLSRACARAAVAPPPSTPAE